jgi:tetratricopeptide (TPR) repeat protein
MVHRRAGLKMLRERLKWSKIDAAAHRYVCSIFSLSATSILNSLGGLSWSRSNGSMNAGDEIKTLTDNIERWEEMLESLTKPGRSSFNSELWALLREWLRDEYATRARGFHKQGMLDRAIQDYNRAVHKYHNLDYRTYDGLGDAYFENGDYEEAHKVYARALYRLKAAKEQEEIDSIRLKCARCHLQLGFKEADERNWSKCRTEFEYAHVNTSPHGQVFSNLANEHPRNLIAHILHALCQSRVSISDELITLIKSAPQIAHEFFSSIWELSTYEDQLGANLLVVIINYEAGHLYKAKWKIVHL